MKQSIQDAVNNQIQAEFHSAYLYLGMAAHFESQSLNGFAHWLKIQWREETEHAMKFYAFLIDRGGKVELKTIEKPDLNFSNPLEAFELVLKHEQYITGRINDLYELATQEKDYPLQTFLHWFIEEQVEEEQSATAIVDKLRLIADNRSALIFLDNELGRRSPD